MLAVVVDVSNCYLYMICTRSSYKLSPYDIRGYDGYHDGKMKYDCKFRLMWSKEVPTVDPWSYIVNG
jgi:hypothetical protein